MVSTDPYGMNSTPIPVSITVRVVGLPRTAVVVWSIHLDHNRVAIAEDHEVWRAHPSIAQHQWHRHEPAPYFAISTTT